MEHAHYMYVLTCADGTLYTGYATDVERRVAEHNGSPRGAKYTHARRPVELAACAAFETRHEAMRAEALFKRLSRGEKDELLAEAESRPLQDVLAERWELSA